MQWPWQTRKQVETTIASGTVAPCRKCGGGGMTGWEKPMGFPPVMVFVPQVCTCPGSRS